MISVVVPIFNVEKYLTECIESILNQTYKDFELILVNDGSTDNSLKICNEYLKKDERIRVINKENGGLSSARNSGIEVAKGEYIAFIDSDDLINENMFEKMMKIAIEKNADIVQCNYQEFYDESEINSNIDISNEIEELNNIEALHKFYENGKSACAVVAWNKIYKTKLFNDVRYPFGRVHEDVFTTHKLLYKANKIICIKDKFYYYRQRANSITTNKYNKKRLDILDAIEERANFLKNIVGNEELYNLEIRNYSYNIMLSYSKYKESNPNDEATLKEIKERAKRMFKKFMKCKKISIKRKVKLVLFML